MQKFGIKLLVFFYLALTAHSLYSSFDYHRSACDVFKSEMIRFINGLDHRAHVDVNKAGYTAIQSRMIGQG